MKLVGINYTLNENGVRTTTLHVNEDFEVYYTSGNTNRGCQGVRASSIYVGTYDCSALKIGMNIEVLYDRAITTSRGTFQPIKRIEILKD